MKCFTISSGGSIPLQSQGYSSHNWQNWSLGQVPHLFDMSPLSFGSHVSANVACILTAFSFRHVPPCPTVYHISRCCIKQTNPGVQLSVCVETNLKMGCYYICHCDNILHARMTAANINALPVTLKGNMQEARQNSQSG
jgi:hypothetical protein